jgi:3'(2'), 5'-bisphosphate nucleotidase
LLAEGKAFFYPRFSPTMERDTADGQAIYAAVGLEVIDPISRKFLSYNRKNLLNGSFLAGTLIL